MLKIIKSSLFRSAGVYTLSNIINAAIPFLLLPILTRYLSPADYGMYAMFQVLIGIISPFVGVNVHGAVSVKYFQREHIEFPRYVSSCFFILFGSCVLMVLFFAIGHEQISRISEIPSDWLWIVIWLCFCQFVVAVLLVILQSSVQPVNYGLFQIAQSIVSFILTIWLVVYLHYDWRGRIVAQAVSTGIFGILCIVIMFRQGWLVFEYDKAYVKDALQFGIPLIPHAIAGFLMSMSDRYIITKFIGLNDAGIYAVACQVALVIGMFQNSFNQAFVPWLFGKLKNGDQNMKKRIVRFSYCYMAGLIVLAIIFSACMPVIFGVIIGPQFGSAAYLVIWIALGYAFDGMYKMVVNYIFYVEKTRALAFITFIMSLFHVSITYILVKNNGMIGAAQATTITYFLTFIVVWIVSNHFFPMPWFSVFDNNEC